MRNGPAIASPDSLNDHHQVFAPAMNFIAKLKNFNKFTGMTAEIRNSNGDILDSATLTDNGKKLKFSFDKDVALDGRKKSKLTISFTDTNGSEGNLKKKNGDLSDLSPDNQSFKTTLNRDVKKGKLNIELSGTPLQTTPPTPPSPPTPPLPPTPIDTTHPRPEPPPQSRRM